MKKKVLLATAMLCTAVCSAQEAARVISSTPVVQQIAVPRRVCSIEQVAVQQPKSGAGALMGAIAGGAVGNSVGGGSGRAVATMLGTFAGAVLGDKVEGAPAAQAANVQRCVVQNFYETGATVYNVVYEFAGKQYTVQLPKDPGPTLMVQVAPVGVAASSSPAAAAPVMPQTVFEAPSTLMVVPTVSPTYYATPYFWPISVELGFGYWGGHRYGHRWH